MSAPSAQSWSVRACSECTLSALCVDRYERPLRDIHHDIACYGAASRLRTFGRTLCLVDVCAVEVATRGECEFLSSRLDRAKKLGVQRPSRWSETTS